jgi:site-specific DNA-cytosine methylase
MTFGSLFTGAGGMDIGLESAGMVCKWQVERDRKCRAILERHWPQVERYDDIRTARPESADVLAGGDPCPTHSRARSIHGSRHPDLSGYFLALVARLRPRWVVRENVPSPSSRVFSAGLDAIGYRTVIISIDAATITGQSRDREFVIGCNQAAWCRFAENLQEREDVAWTDAPRVSKADAAACLTTHPCRYDSSDNYVFEEQPRPAIRILDAEERERLAGFPSGWTTGFAETARAKFYGNCCVPAKAEWIGRRIMEASLKP